jgi:hypothetical protein
MALFLVCGESAILKLGEQEGDKISIIDPTFVDRVLDIVPCYVGGECLYDDTVQLQGRISLYDSKMVIGSVESGKLFREEEGGYTF